MKYKVVSLAIAILLIATPIGVYAQQKSYIVVETPNTTEPTTVITGQPFEQTYVVRFIDLTDSGEQIIIQEDFLNNLKTIGDFEILKFRIDKETKQGEFLEHIWYLRFTLNIVNPKKGAYIIPSLKIPWKHKKAGQEANDPTIPINYEFGTDEVHINYVTTIPEKAPYLTIRDEFCFGDFKTREWFWWAAAWLLRAISLLLVLITIMVLIRSRRKIGTKSYEPEDRERDNQMQVGEKVKSFSRLTAWFYLRASIRHLKNCRTDMNDQVGSNCRKVEEEVVLAIKSYLRAKIPRLNVGSTPLAMAEYISKNISPFSTQRNALLQMAQKADLYQTDIEKGKERDPRTEAQDLCAILKQLRWHRRALLFFRHSFARIKNRLMRVRLVIWLANKINKRRHNAERGE